MKYPLRGSLAPRPRRDNCQVRVSVTSVSQSVRRRSFCPDKFQICPTTPRPRRASANGPAPAGWWKRPSRARHRHRKRPAASWHRFPNLCVKKPGSPDPSPHQPFLIRRPRQVPPSRVHAPLTGCRSGVWGVVPGLFASLDPRLISVIPTGIDRRDFVMPHDRHVFALRSHETLTPPGHTRRPAVREPALTTPRRR
jgi:hypothetical protein